MFGFMKMVFFILFKKNTVKIGTLHKHVKHGKTRVSGQTEKLLARVVLKRFLESFNFILKHFNFKNYGNPISIHFQNTSKLIVISPNNSKYSCFVLQIEEVINYISL